MSLFKRQKEEEIFTAPEVKSEPAFEFKPEAEAEEVKEAVEEVQPEVKPAMSIKQRTVISEGTTFIGNILTEDPIEIKGCVKGNISSSTDVLISQTGNYDGNASAQDLVIEGCATGTAEIVNNTVVTCTGSFEGKLTSTNLLTKEGAAVEGTLKLGHKKAPAPAPAPAQVPEAAEAAEETAETL